MELTATAIKGTLDMLPKDAYKWHYIEDVAKDTARLYGFRELRTPVFEKTELFQRSVGDTTDVVQKEMYTFDDKGGRSITLRPEGTAGVMRSVLEHGLFNDALPVKAYYITTCYRYEKPQKGRLREFHQFGVECIGAAAPTADAEVITLGKTLLDNLGLKNITLEINSIGCPQCRAAYTPALKEYFEQYKSELCPTCLDRLDRNPMRILDCKSEICSKIAENAPKILDFICDDCKSHFEEVKNCLDAAGVEYVVNPTIVRGLDYYTKTVFEFLSNGLAICAGGRYDGLADELGGVNLPSLGFAAGMERILMLMEEQNAQFPQVDTPDIYIAPLGNSAGATAVKLCNTLRAEGFSAITDMSGRGLKAQMKYADKIGAKYTMVLGDNEVESGVAKIKDMNTGDQKEVEITTGLVQALYDMSINKAFDDLNESINKMEV